MQVAPGGSSDRWWISPVIPTVANCTLAALWLFSAFGGWGDAAFCGEAEAHDDGCAATFGVAVVASAGLGALAVGMALGAWAFPQVRRDRDRLDGILTAAALVWVVAETVLFAGGYVAKP